MGGGKPAARQGDMTRKGLDIVQGSAGVLIGAPTGVRSRRMRNLMRLQLSQNFLTC
ncbi:rhs core protein with extension [Shigella sonnei]|nr:rhs core protein with extension [Shigella sonnei]